MGLGAEENIGTTTLAQVATVLRSPHQHTLNTSLQCEGIGLHTGQTVQVQINPAPAHTGRYFVRTDLTGPVVPIPARIASLHQTRLSTELGAGNTTVRTVEHVLAALTGLGIDNAEIVVHGPEVPLLDGSAQPWVQAIIQAGWVNQSLLRPNYPLDLPLAVHQDDAFVAAIPAPQTLLTYGIDFPHPAIGRQWHSMALEDFIVSVAPARTFGFAEQVEKLHGEGLIKGGSLENALVCGPQGWLNPPLRYANEPVRHKLLDLLGDLSLLGSLPCAHIVAYKASHALHTQLVQRLASLYG